MKIYVVVGTTGEYSDRSEWVVCAYTREEDAKVHIAKAKEYAEAWRAARYSDEFYVRDLDDLDSQQKAANPMDPHFSCDYTGTTYDMQEVELYEKFTSPEPIQ